MLLVHLYLKKLVTVALTSCNSVRFLLRALHILNSRSSFSTQSAYALSFIHDSFFLMPQ